MLDDIPQDQLAEILNKGLEDIKNGRVVKASEVLAKIIEKLNK